MTLLGTHTMTSGPGKIFQNIAQLPPPSHIAWREDRNAKECSGSQPLERLEEHGWNLDGKIFLRFSRKYFPSWIPGIKNVSKASQPILDNSVAFRKYGVTSFKYFT